MNGGSILLILRAPMVKVAESYLPVLQRFAAALAVSATFGFV